tara:strand:+ start:729 stop:1064 length:336 start_codon:yes stop_codon:yes gene_type:complete
VGKVNTFEKKLKSGRKVKIKELPIDIIDDLKDIPEVYFLKDNEKTVKNISKAQTAWVRHGLVAGDFDNWVPNGKQAPDSVLRQLTSIERTELVALIQECQAMSPTPPSSSD